MSEISLVETSKIDEKIELLLRQTDYTKEVAFEKLKENEFDEIKVIRSYFGINEKKNKPIHSINQEIYKQIRHRLDSNMRDYQERVEKGEVKKIV
jgi:hypothetical protein